MDAELVNAVVKVGDGRGFIIEASNQRLVITAAHCLPHFPPCHGASYVEERTYRDLLGPLNESAPKVWAECLFADPVADIAVLGSPDDQVLYDEAIAFEALTEEAPALRIGEAAIDALAWLLTLDGRWTRCAIQRRNGWPLWIENAEEAIRGGMSGSPILNDDTSAIGVVCVGGGIGLDSDTIREGGPNPRLTHNLPGWVLL